MGFLQSKTTGATFQINSVKLYVPVVTLSINGNIKLLTFRKINRLFALSFKLGRDISTINSFNRYYLPLAEIKDFNALIDNKTFLDQFLKSTQEAYEKLAEMSRNDDYMTGNLLDYLYHQKYCKLIGIDLSRQTNKSIPQQINFVGKLEEDNGATMFLSLKSSKNLF